MSTLDEVTISMIGEDKENLRYEQLDLTNDFMFCKIMSKPDNCKKLLEIIFQNKEINFSQPPDYQNIIRLSPSGKSVQFDIRAFTSTDDIDIEMQNLKNREIPKRARYYQSMMDIEQLQKGELYTSLKHNWIIFFCTKDLFGKGLPVYTFENICVEDKETKLNDMTTKMFYNCNAYERMKSVEIESFLRYLQTGDAKTDFTKKIAFEIDSARDNPLWRKEFMDWEMQRRMIFAEAHDEGFASGEKAGYAFGIQQGIEQGIQKGMQQGIEQGIEQGQELANKKIAEKLIGMGFEVDKISLITGFDKEKIMDIKKAFDN